jgi:hypothetical protein
MDGRFLRDAACPQEPRDLVNPSGHAWERQIQFLDRRTRLLDRGAWPDPRQWVISDFYLDQCLAYGRIELDLSGYERLREAWSAAQESVVLPKFLMVIDEPAATDPAISTSCNVPISAERLKEELGALAARRGIGPVLHAAGMDEAARVDELVAAIVAMT